MRGSSSLDWPSPASPRSTWSSTITPARWTILEERRPENAIFIIGADELAELRHWKEPARVLELVSLGVATRPGVPEGELHQARARLPAPDRISFFALQPMAVSSTEIRDRVAHGEPIDDLVPTGVAEAIRRLGLYRDA